MLDRLLTAAEAAVLALWAGAMAGFAFVFAPAASKVVVPRGMDTFSSLIGTTIRGLGSFGAVCGALAIVASLGRALAPESRRLAFTRVALVAAGMTASGYVAGAIIPHMDTIAATIPGPIDSVPKTDPRRAAYDAEHQNSTRVYGVAFFCVLAAAMLVPFGRRRSV
jgi:hypothetical protein